MKTKLCLVVPCFNESAILVDTINVLQNKLDMLIKDSLITPDSFLFLVNDGSSDTTWEIIKAAHARNPRQVKGASLSANCGHQAALLAGLIKAKDMADAVISLDADLQDDIDILPDFVREFHKGNDIVYGVRSDRSSDSFFKRFTAEGFYKIMQWLGVKSIYNHADFRLLSKRAIEALCEYREVNLYIRGIIPLLGFHQSIVLYTRKKAERPTHYPIHKMLMLAWNGITSFSVKPIRLITAFGFSVFSLGILYCIYALIGKFQGNTVAGWTSIILLLMFLGGIQLISIGVIGEYIAKTYIEVKDRPRFHIQETTESIDKNS